MKHISSMLLGLMIGTATNLYAQKPVRTSVFPQKQTTDTPAEVSSKSMPRRFSDTIAVGNTAPKSTQHSAAPANIVEEVEKANALYAKERYVDAYEKFTQIATTIKSDDPLLYEVQFMQGECASVLGQLDKAEKILTMLSAKPNIPTGVRERTLIRLGHVFCGLGKAEQAAKAFAKFRQEFPASQYNAVANCDSVK